MKHIPQVMLLCAAVLLTACGNDSAAPSQTAGTRVAVAQQTDTTAAVTTTTTAVTTTTAADDFSVDLGTLEIDSTGNAERGMPMLTTAGTAVTEPPVTTVSANPENAVLHLVSFPAIVRRNEDVTLTAQGKPDTEYRIHVYYTSGESSAEGLEPQVSDAAGSLSWTWQIGGKTRAGSFHIDITGGEELLRIPLNVTEG